MAYPVTLNGRTYTLADFEGQNYVDGLPDAFEDFVTHAGDVYNDTSTSSVSIGTGSKTFTVSSGKPYQAGTPLRIADAAAPSTNFLDAIVTSYSGTTLVVDVFGFAGSGTKSSWTVNIGGAKTVDGTLAISQGGTGATTAAAARTALGLGTSDSPTFAGLTVTGTTSFSDISISDVGDIAVDSVSGDADSNTKMAFPGSDVITFTTGGSERVRIDASGNVGIGQDSLGFNSGGLPLVVGGGSGNTGLTIFSGDASFGSIHFADTETTFGGSYVGSIGYSHADNFMKFGVNASERMRIDSSGNVGIGTSSPSSRLQVVDDSYTKMIVSDNSATPDTPFSVSSGANSVVLENTNNGNLSGEAVALRNSDNSIAFRTGGSERVRIDSSGRLGLGTTVPATTLTVEGSSANGIELNRNGVDAASSARLFFDSSTNCSSMFNSGGNLVFATGATPGSASGTERMRLTSDGRVGIGTTSPGAELEVASSLPELRLSDTDGTNHHGTLYQTGGLLVMRSRFGTGRGAIKFEGDTGSAQTEYSRFTSAGTFLVGKTSTGNTNVGTQITGDGYAAIVCTSTNIPFYLENKATGGNCRISFINDGHGQSSLGLNNNGDFTIYDTTGSTTRFNVTDAKVLTATGGLAGIELGGTGTGNRLDDYEEGTWTPTPSNYEGTLTVDSATYTRVGNLVTARASVTFDATTDSSGVAFTGLPFSHTGEQKGNGGFITRNGVNEIQHIKMLGSGTASLRNHSDGTVSYTTMASKRLEFCLVYETSA